MDEGDANDPGKWYTAWLHRDEDYDAQVKRLMAYGLTKSEAEKRIRRWEFNVESIVPDLTAEELAEEQRVNEIQVMEREKEKKTQEQELLEDHIPIRDKWFTFIKLFNKTKVFDCYIMGEFICPDRDEFFIRNAIWRWKTEDV